jgi:hypothetical protein
LFGRDRHEPHQLDLPTEQLAHIRVVFNDEYFFHGLQLWLIGEKYKSS